MIDKFLKESLFEQHQLKKELGNFYMTRQKMDSGDFITHYSSGKPVQEGDIPLSFDLYHGGDLEVIYLRIDEIDFYAKNYKLTSYSYAAYEGGNPTGSLNKTPYIIQAIRND